jgi:hypothetical protein
MKTMTEIISQIGYHYYPDDLHYTNADLSVWLPILRSLGARWLTLKASCDRAVPEDFLKSLIENGITPVIRLPIKIGTPLEAYNDLLAQYARWGVKYVIVYDCPNLQSSWRDNEWTRIRLIERFTDFLIPMLRAQLSAGLQPIFPPLEPGGDYWDTAFLEAALASMKRRAPDLINQILIAVYAWTYDRPLDWGAGGPGKWVETLPYHTPEGSQDQRGLRIFDWYTAIYQKYSAHTPAFLVAAGGSRLTTSEPIQSDLEKHTQDTLAITRMLESSSLSSNLLNYSFYCLASANPVQDSAWFKTIAEPLPVVKAMQQLIQAGSNEKVIDRNTNTSAPKPIAHYVLLPRDLDAGSLWDWKSFGDFIRTAHPVIGFSAEEARYAERVTLVGDENQLPPVLEDTLRSEACIVSRLDLAPFSEILPENDSTHEAFIDTGVRYG